MQVVKILKIQNNLKIQDLLNKSYTQEITNVYNKTFSLIADYKD